MAMDLREFKVIKVTLLGDSGVGITAIRRRLVENTFLKDDTYSSGGYYIVNKKFTFVNRSINLAIHDVGSANAIRSRSLWSQIQDSRAFVVIYDITKGIDAFENALNKVDELKEKTKDAVIILVGNKRDLIESRKIPKELGINAAKEYKVKFYAEVSAKTGQNVEELFEAVAEALLPKEQAKNKSDEFNLFRILNNIFFVFSSFLSIVIVLGFLF